MDNMSINVTELAIQSVEDGLSPFANGSAASSSSSSSSLFLRRIEFHPARKPFSGFGNRGDYRSGDFRIETLNPDCRSNKRPLGLNHCQPGKKADGSDLLENGLDLEFSFGVACRRIGAGLHNLGNTCFLNSVLQCLTYTEPLAAYLQSGKHKKNTCHIAGFCALCAIQKHVSQALQSTGRSLVPKDLVSNLRCISRNFRNARQEDAHEYMVNLLESMHKCCLPSGVPSESPAAYEKSLVHKIFGGFLRSQVQCQQCLYCSNKFDPFLDLSLEIYRADTLSVALRNFTAPELLDGGEKQYQCQQCKQKVRAKKRLTVHKAPYVLTIHLKRFYAHDPGQKVDKKVTFDCSLNMKPFVSDTYEGDLKYSLYGVLVHYGHNTHSGHYVCFVRTSSGIWYLLNDNEVREVSEKRVLEQKAYMLFYVRDRKVAPSRKPVDIVRKENVKPNGNNFTDLVFKQLSKEHVNNAGSVGNRSLPVVNQKDFDELSKIQNGAPNVSTSKIFPKKTSNDVAISESILGKANSSVGPSTSELQKDPTKEASSVSKANPSAEPPSISYSAKVDNATVQTGANINDCVDLHCPPMVKLETNGASEKMNPILNGRVDETVENPGISLPVDSVDRMLNKSDDVMLEVKPCCEISQDGESSGVKIVQNTSELVDSSSGLVKQNGCLCDKDSNCLPRKKIKKKLLKRRNNKLQFGKNLFIASFVSRKKKKHEKSKRRRLETQNLIKEQLSEGNSLSSEVKSLKSMQGEDKSCLKSRGNTPIETVEEGSKKRTNQNSDVSGGPKQLKVSSSSLNENKHQDVNDFGETSQKRKSENEIMCMLTQGLEATTVARWDGLESSLSHTVESNSSGRVGYVLDEWDEEYDRGKRKKLRSNKHTFGGPNPFQEIASLNKQFKKPKMDRSSSGKEPFRI